MLLGGSCTRVIPSDGVRASSSRRGGAGRNSSGRFHIEAEAIVAAKKIAVAPDKVHDTIGSHMLADGFDIVLDLEKSKGTRLYDSKSGKYMLDFFTCFASSPSGSTTRG